MSTEIDWSKAPEGATHWGAETDDYYEAWYKNTGEKWYCATKSTNWNWLVDNELEPYRFQEMIARPYAWSGEGLPPVGTVCECQMRGYGDVWQKVIVLAHHNGHAWVTGDDGKHCFTVPPHGNFHPIKTPEQIAKQERDDAVHQMGLDAGFHGSVQDFATRLYMLGYRKVTQ